MHAAAVDAEHRLGHEGGMQAVLLGQGLDRQLEGHDVVGGGQRLGVLEVDLVLALGNLVVGSLDLEAHLLQRQADLAAGALAVIQRAQVEVTGLVGGGGGGVAGLIGLEEEELALRADVEGVAHVGGLLQHALEHAAGIAHEGGAVRIVHVADQAGNLAVLRSPGKHREGIQIRIEVLVGLVDANEAFNGAAVDHDLVVDSLLNLGCGDGDILQLTENVGELHADELHVSLANQADDVFLAVLTHDCDLLKNLSENRKRANWTFNIAPLLCCGYHNRISMGCQDFFASEKC